MKVQTSTLIGPAFEWAVAKCEGHDPYYQDGQVRWLDPRLVGRYFVAAFSTDWAQGGPVIDREGIMFQAAGHAAILAYLRTTGTSGTTAIGSTHLVAAMRCRVASKLGDEVDVPAELLSTGSTPARRPKP